MRHIGSSPGRDTRESARPQRPLAQGRHAIDPSAHHSDQRAPTTTSRAGFSQPLRIGSESDTGTRSMRRPGG
jgi:hypothetical protein